jgi:hypothetical protein
MIHPNARWVSLQRTQRAVLPLAFVSGRSLSVILCSLFLFAFGPLRFPELPRLYWAIGGLLVSALMVLSVMGDDQFAEHVIVPRLFRQLLKVNLHDLQTCRAFGEMRQAYIKLAAALILERRHLERDRWLALVGKTDEWINDACDLLLRLDAARGRRPIASDDYRLADDIEALTSKLSIVNDEAHPKDEARPPLEQQINQKKQRLAYLKDCEGCVSKSESQINTTIAVMGATASLVGSLNGPKIDHLLNDIGQQIESLCSAYASFDSVYYRDT